MTTPCPSACAARTRHAQNALDQQSPVCQTRQRVVQGLVGKPGLEVASLADVADDTGEQPARSHFDLAYGKIHRKGAAVAAQTGHLTPDADDARSRVRR